ncbi:DprA-like winged helix domain-containing protein, partial [Pseudomonas aeruginosa]
DITDELGGGSQPGTRRPPEPADDPGDADNTAHPVLEALGFDPLHLDALQARCGLDTATLQAQLLELELAARVARLDDGCF